MGPSAYTLSAGSVFIRLCWMTARTIPAVASGRRVIDEPSRSSKVYISFETMSVSAPMPRANSSVSSKTGVRISR